jgi:hypothetical protein
VGKKWTVVVVEFGELRLLFQREHDTVTSRGPSTQPGNVLVIDSLKRMNTYVKFVDVIMLKAIILVTKSAMAFSRDQRAIATHPRRLLEKIFAESVIKIQTLPKYTHWDRKT